MRTLDETIKGIEYCLNPVDELGNCNGDCPYCPSCDPEGTVVKLDALHYLKEYSSKQDTIAEQLAELEQKNDHVCELAKTVCEAYDRLCNRLAEEYRNDALSWDELKLMVGKPVWVEPVDEKGYWFVIEFFNNNSYYGGDRVCFTNDVMLNRSDLGKTWQAYRKERKNEKLVS